MPNIFTPEDYGAAGDGTTDDTDAFAQLSAAVQAAGSGLIEFAPGATYLVAGPDNQPFSSTPLYSVYNWGPVEPYILDLVGCASVIVRGNGATMKNAGGGKYGTFNPATGQVPSPDSAPHPVGNWNSTTTYAVGKAVQHNGAFYFAIASSTNQAPPNATYWHPGAGAATPYYALIRVEDCGQVEIENLTLDGNIQNTTKGAQYGDTGIQLQMTGIYYVENAGNVATRNVVAKNQGADGFIVDEIGSAESTDASEWLMQNCTATTVGRNAMSVVGGNGLLFDNCTFKHSGNGAGGVASAPGAGVDLEAEGGKLIRNLVFRRCQFLDNNRQGLVADSGDTRDVTFEDCKFRKGYAGTSSYLLWLNKPRLRFVRCQIIGTSVHMWNGGNYPDDATKFIDCDFILDHSYAPGGTLTYNNNQFFDGGLAFVDFRRCRFTYNLSGVSNNANLDSMRFTDCTIEAKNGTLNFYGRMRGRTALIENGGTIGRVPDGLVVGRTTMGHAEDKWTFRTGGVTTTYGATISAETGDRFGAATNGADADATLTVGTDRTVQKFTATLTANRSVTLSTSGALQGSRFRISRTGGGAFNLNVGTGPLKALATNQWCEVLFSGGAWQLTAFGSL